MALFGGVYALYSVPSTDLAPGGVAPTSVPGRKKRSVTAAFDTELLVSVSVYNMYVHEMVGII